MALSVAGCDLFGGSARITVQTPPLPARWMEAWGEASYRIEWQSALGPGRLEQLVEAGVQVAITIPRLPPVAIEATPVWPQPRPAGPTVADGEALASAGAVWPLDAPDASLISVPTVRLTFERGPVTRIARTLLAAGADLRAFSFERLAAEIDARLDDPYNLDCDRIVAAIAAHAMRESYVRPRVVVDTGLVAPAGRWYDGFNPARAPAEGAWPALPVGMSVFYSDDGRRCAVEVDTEGRARQAFTGRGS